MTVTGSRSVSVDANAARAGSLSSRWPSESDGFHHAPRRGSLQGSVGTDAQSVVDGGESKPQRREGRNGEDLGVVESNRTKALDVLSCDVVGITRHLARP